MKVLKGLLKLIFNKKLFKEVMLSGIVMGFIVFIFWKYMIETLQIDVRIARGYIMAIMVFLQNVHVFNCRSEDVSVFKLSIKSNMLVLFSVVSSIFLQIIVMEVPIFSKYLQTVSIPIIDLLRLLLLSFIILIVMEVYKIFINRKKCG